MKICKICESGLLLVGFLAHPLMRWGLLISALVLKYGIFCEMKCEFISLLHTGFPE